MIDIGNDNKGLVVSKGSVHLRKVLVFLVLLINVIFIANLTSQFTDTALYISNIKENTIRVPLYFNYTRGCIIEIFLFCNNVINVKEK